MRRFKLLSRLPVVLTILFAAGTFAVLAEVMIAGAMVAVAMVAGPENFHSGGHYQTTRSVSVKCDMGDIPDISKRRLVDCESATLLHRAGEDVRRSAVLFQIDPQDAKISQGVRAELRHYHEAVNGEEIWYRFSTKLPQDFPIESDHRLVLSQWHERVGPDGPSLRPPLSHRLWNGRFVVTLWNQDRIDQRGVEGDGEILFEIPRIELGAYHEFIYKTRWSDGNNGQIVGWMRKCRSETGSCDGGKWREIVRKSGQNGYPSAKGYYFKYGLYTVSDFDVPFTALHKNYQAGPSAGAVGATERIFSH